MITANIPRLGQSQTIIGPCEGPYGVRKKFYLEGVQVIVPDMVTDRNLRRLIDGGLSFDNAYRQVGWWDQIPPEGMRQCCYEILRTKWYDPVSNTRKISGWGHTCAGYFRCFEAYVEGLRQTAKRGRMVVAPGVYSPSPEEEACIKQRFYLSNSIARAYSECDAIDILPRFPGAIDKLNQVMRSSIRTPMYEMIKTIVGFAPEEPTHHPAPDEEEEPSSRLLLYAGIAAVAVLVVTR